MQPTASFALASASSQFNERSTQIFEQLTAIPISTSEQDSDSDDTPVIELERLDFQRSRLDSPSWTYYSLEDVPEMSAADNLRAAKQTSLIINSQREQQLVDEMQICQLDESTIELPDKINYIPSQKLAARVPKITTGSLPSKKLHFQEDEEPPIVTITQKSEKLEQKPVFKKRKRAQ
jgi:hypothetical protein